MGGKRDSYHHGDLRNALLEGAIALIREKGTYHLSLREVARRAGVSHAAPYRHFADKNALMAALALDGFRMLSAALRGSIENYADPAAAFLDSAWAYVRFATEHPAHVQVMFGQAVEDREAFAELCAEGDESFALLVQIVEKAQAAGVIRAGESRTLALTAWSLVHGLAKLITENGVVPLEQARDVTKGLAELLYQGLRAPDKN